MAEAARACSNRRRALIGSWVTPSTTGAIEIERGGDENTTINHGDRRYDDGDGRHNDSNDGRHDDGDGRHDDSKGQHSDGKRQQGDRRYDVIHGRGDVPHQLYWHEGRVTCFEI